MDMPALQSVKTGPVEQPGETFRKQVFLLRKTCNGFGRFFPFHCKQTQKVIELFGAHCATLNSGNDWRNENEVHL